MNTVVALRTDAPAQSSPRCRRRRGVRPRRPAVLLAAVAFALDGCGADAPTGVPIGVPGATAYKPLATYAFWWSLAESCSGLHGDFAAVHWARVPGDAIPGSDGQYQGQWSSATNTITVVVRDTAAGPLIRHEMLHALLGAGYGNGHPPAYFGARCGGTVACEGPCATEVAAATPTPSSAPTVLPDDLVVAARIIAPASGTSAAGGAFAIVITAQNPTATAGWVARSTNPNVAETPDFGYSLTAPLFPDTAVNVAPGARTYFAAGESKHFVFDLNTGTFPRGSYVLRGSFATAWSAPTTVTFPP